MRPDDAAGNLRPSRAGACGPRRALPSRRSLGDREVGPARHGPWSSVLQSALVPALVGLTACDGPQSTLAPAGRDAERIADLFWWMAGGAALVWCAVMALTVHALLRPAPLPRRRAAILIIGGGVAVPTVLLAVLLGFGLRTLPQLLEPAPEGALRIRVIGEQWWWRVVYEGPGGPVELANELRLPVGERVELRLESPDVIHSFWVPALGGKVDMIPGRTTRLALEPTRTGTFRGVCAEFCGTAHTWMAFEAVVLPAAEFDRWLESQRAAAREPAGDPAGRGAILFRQLGCGACHAVRGTGADGVVGPDLTHVGSRRTLGAGILPNDPDGFRRWLAAPGAVKPGVRMPAFGMLPAGDVEALARYLDGLG